MKTLERFVWEPGDVEWNARGDKGFSEFLHPRDAEGRFTEIGGLGDIALADPEVVPGAGGFSLALGGDRPKTGWMVSRFGSERSFSVEQLAADQEMSFVPGNPWHDNVKNALDEFVSDHVDELQEPGVYLGGWLASGRLFLDVSENIQDESEATRFAQSQHQFAMYNAETGEYREFEQTRRAASRKAAGQLKENEKVLLDVDPDGDLEELTQRLLRALMT